MSDGDDGARSMNQIAVIGMAGRFPGASTLGEYWQNLERGVESVKFFTREELLADGESPELLEDPSYVRAWPVLEGIDRFDAGFFGMSPRDAAIMDPQHRFFLEVAWSALEHAGYAADKVTPSTGVFAACGLNHYMMHHLVRNAEVMATVGEWLVRHTGNDMNFLATRVSYQLNLKGPSLNVQTACSSSLVAIHLACQSLLNAECDLALAGATTMSLPQTRGYLFKPGEILSADGHCRPFDAGSTGTLFGSGTGCVVLKRLSDALADGDNVLAVVLGSAINNDGSQKVGYLAPSVEGQARVISEALAIAGVDAGSISYVEAHGTGTTVGDPIEVTALQQAYREHTEASGFCRLGSVKGNIGHLGEAAGMAGFIKTVLALQNEQLPPSINYEKPNPAIDFARSPFTVNGTLSAWPRAQAPRRAGVTALGAGGTNAHLILEEAPRRQPPTQRPRRDQLLLLSARSKAALERACVELAAHLEQHPELALADVAYTLHAGRQHFAQRRAIACDDTARAIAALRAPDAATGEQAPRRAPRVVFMFPGGGAQYPGMGAQLYDSEPAYKASFDDCLSALEPEVAASIRALLVSAPADPGAAAAELERPSIALPALFATEYATAKLLMAWGVTPDATIGHSMGEYTAATLSGVFSLPDAMKQVRTRGVLFERLPVGGMLSVELPEGELIPLLGPELSLAAVNAPGLCAASGPAAAIESLAQELERRGIESTRIHISVAAHSSMLEPILADFEQHCRSVRLTAPARRLISNLTGTWLTPEEATDPLYWVRHLRNTVRFADGIDAVVSGGDAVLIEVGPGRVLSSLARQHASKPFATSSLRHPQENVPDLTFLMNTLGRLWQRGVNADFASVCGGPAQRVPLPSYCFAQDRYWIAAAEHAKEQSSSASLRKQPELRDWFLTPAWKRAATPAVDDAPGPWLVFCHRKGMGERIAETLAAEVGAPVIRVFPGDMFVKVDDGAYCVRPQARADYDALLEDLVLRNSFPRHLVYAWSLTSRLRWPLRLLSSQSRIADLADAEGACFLGPLFLAQALALHERPLTFSVVSNELHALAGDAAPAPEKALLLGPVRVIPREFPHVRTRSIDVPHAGTQKDAIARAARLVADELRARPDDATVALRPSGRWVQTYERLPLEPAREGQPAIRQGGVYLITGGLGGIGLTLAEHLARAAKAKLVLTGRSGLPERGTWEELSANDRVLGARLERVRAIEAAGGEVLTVAADVTSVDDMQRVKAEALARFGVIHGIIHSAGMIDDGLISLKTAEAAMNVISVKAKGALALDEVFGRLPLDFFAVFSSVSSILGLEGQVDYTAANAFLDAFAERRATEATGTHTVSIGWNAWQETGMAVSIAEQATSAELARSSVHPGLERVTLQTADKTIYVTSFSRTKHWLLSEHVVRDGDALIPGTGYLELARAGFARGSARPIELRDVTFIRPFAVRVGQSRDLRLMLSTDSDGATEFTFYGGQEDNPFVLGRVGEATAPPPARASLAAVSAACALRERRFDGFLEQSFMAFGPRWANVDRVRYGDDQALVFLTLPESFVVDLEDYRLHPALLDMATGGGQALIAGFDPANDFFVPFGYERVTIFAPLRRRVCSHIRYRGTGAKDTATFDVTLYAEDGEALVDIAGFTMKRIANRTALAPEADNGQEVERGATRIGSAVRLGITNREGADAFMRILSARVCGQVVASSVDVGTWLASVAATARTTTSEAGETSDAGFARPTLSGELVAPRNDVEKELAAIWRELLGLREVGVRDDFFELGGQSLVAVRLFNRIRKRYGVSLPLSTLFEAPNIESCARIIAEDLGISLEANGVATNGEAHADGAAQRDSVPPSKLADEARKKVRWPCVVFMQPKGEAAPFYCAAGLGGNLNNLRKLAILAGEERPFLGLQPPGADDPSKLIYSVEELAAYYLRELRQIQPEGPYLLGGYSGGGITAYEMCRQLTADGQSVAFLGFIDSYSPQMPLRSRSERTQIHMNRLKSQGPRYVWDTLRRRVEHERYELLRKAGRHLRGVLPDRFRYEQVEDSWLVAQDRYAPPPWRGRATLLRARELGSISLWTGVKDDDAHGWGRYLEDGVEVRWCPGNHNTMCDEPNVRVLAATLRNALRAADASLPKHDGKGLHKPSGVEGTGNPRGLL